MCAEFEQHLPAVHGWAEVLEGWPAELADAAAPIFPTQACWTAERSAWVRRQWSLIPPWADSPTMKFATFNARAETLADKPAFRSAWKHGQRCLIPASRYFEWGVTPAGKRKHEVRAANGDVLMMAGLHERWAAADQTIDSCTVVTVPANEAMRDLHGRMPLLLDARNAASWLDGSLADAVAVLRSVPQARLSYQTLEKPLAPGQTGSLF